MNAESPPPARPRLSIGVGAGIVLVLVVLVVTVLVSALAPRGSSEVLVPTANSSDVPAASGGPIAPSGDPGSVIYVHVLGAVVHPGLYELHEGDRIIDAVAAAGGYTAEADQAPLNLARVVVDGEQIYAPVVGESPPPSPDGAASSGGGDETAAVNLNTADQEALETLPRVGPETARKILEYRETNGPFTSVDQLMEVPGIGQKTLDGLRDAAVV